MQFCATSNRTPTLYCHPVCSGRVIKVVLAAGFYPALLRVGVQSLLAFHAIQIATWRVLYFCSGRVIEAAPAAGFYPVLLRVESNCCHLNRQHKSVCNSLETPLLLSAAGGSSRRRWRRASTRRCCVLSTRLRASAPQRAALCR